jgi:hypothetical protein
VLSIQTFGSYGANFNPHCHAIISDGVWTAEGVFLELPSLDTAAVCELFRHLLLRRLHLEKRLSERFMENLFSWVHPGFSVFAGDPRSPQDAGQLECLARYITRPPLAADSIRRRDDGLLQITTPPDPRTGSTVRLLDPLGLDPRRHGPHPRSRPALREVLRNVREPRARSPRAFGEQQTAPAAGPGAMADTAS